MPRNLEEERRQTLAGMPPLVKSPPSLDQEDALDEHRHGRDPNDLHPITGTLNPSYLDSCVTCENAAFDEALRGDRNKILYRLTICGELCMGLFTTSTAPDSSVPTTSTAHIVESGSPERKEILLAHVLATKTRNELISTDDMAVPANWREKPHDAARAVGHQEDGRTVAIHSLAVLPEYQKRGLGRTLLKAYVQRIQNAGVADRIAIITHEHLVPFYEAVGFVNRGPSKNDFQGVRWVDMVLEFSSTGAAVGGGLARQLSEDD
ncbi:hypothetical protein IWX90DRAFT_508418 [Phyllosticta citrichinensis]|uniref:N-acetyltransferase domain-containing protein n=1 Tax=Phyllosticta citrichinensis TaxID=1130410 RepID=A0ABR1XM15_9PEZI